MHAIDSDTRLCGVVGHPLGHSLSPVIHNAGYQALDINFVYIALDAEDIEACLSGFRAIHGFRGLSVTIPHKLAAIKYLDVVDSLSQKIGSVNTISKSAGALVGTSTDGAGTLRAFEEAGVSLAGKRVLFLGSGGAVRAVSFAVAEESGAAAIQILGRTLVNVEALVSDLSETTHANVSGGDLSLDLPSAMEAADVIIQGTPMGMLGADAERSVVPADLLAERQVVFDMVYRPLKTRLIQDAERRGCKTILGIEMLLYQAALQFELWTGKDAPIAAMRSAVSQYFD